MRDHSLEVPVWLFGECMRELEGMVLVSKVYEDLFGSWQDAWLDVEARLVDVGLVDRDSYAEMVCSEIVTVKNLDGAEWRAWDKVMRRVHERLKMKARVSEDTAEQGSAAYEVDESAVLLGVMRRILSDWSRDYVPE